MPRPLCALLALVSLASSVACKPASSPAAPANPGASSATALPPDTTGRPAPPAGAFAYVTHVTLLRREPSELRKVTGPGKKQVANVLATLQRGEKVTIAQGEVKVVGDEEWVRVRSSDDQEGFLKRSNLLEGDGITEATVLLSTDVFDRPDLLAANASRKLEPATLLLVVKSKEPFSEVNVWGGPDAWVLTDRLSTTPTDVSIAKLTEKALWLRKNEKADEANQLLTLARGQFPGAPLLDAMATQLGQAPAAPEMPPAAAPAALQPEKAPTSATPSP